MFFLSHEKLKICTYILCVRREGIHHTEDYTIILRMKDKMRPMKDFVEKAIGESVFPGCVIGIVQDDTTHIFSFGRFTYELASSPVTENTIFDVASITKVIPTSLLAIKLIEQKKMALTDLLIYYIPEYEGPYQKDVTIFHLLTQTLSFPFALSSFSNSYPEEILHQILYAKLTAPPGTVYGYSNSTSILLGMVIERAGGKSLDQLASEYFFEPLGMTETTFHPDTFSVKQIAPTEIINGIKLRGVVHDESARALATTVGSAGLFSTAGDLLTFLHMLLSGGSVNKKHFFLPATVDSFSENQSNIPQTSLGLGWELNQPWMGKNHSEKTIGKTGYTGCFVLCDMEKKVGIVMLSNHTYPLRRSDRSLINRVRSRLADMIFASF